MSVRLLARVLARRVAVVAATAAVGTGLTGVAPAYATAGPGSFVTMLGGGDYIGGTADRLYRSDDSTLQVGGTARNLSLSVSGGTDGKSFHIDLVAPSTQVLAPGVYETGRHYPVDSAVDPALDVYGDGRGCSPGIGRFVVYDVAVGGDGVINRFRGTYEHRCVGAQAAVLGEISINEPTDGKVLVADDVVDWPESYLGIPGRTLPVWVYNSGTAPLTVSGVSLGGANHDEFAIVSNGCSTVAPGSACAVFARFTAAGEGLRTATLTLSDSSAAGTRTAALHGRGIPGHTSLAMRSDAGDFVGDGQSYDYTPANATFNAEATPSKFTMYVGSESSSWTATLAAASGDILTAGRTYDGATRPSPYGPGPDPALDVYGNGRSCNTLTGSFTVIEAVFKDGTGPIQRFAATFEQHCEGAAPVLHGWIAWRATEANTPDTTAPGTPLPVENLTAYPDNSSVVLGWDNPTGDSFQNVVVRGVGGTTPPDSPTAGVLVYSGAAEGAYLGGLTPGRPYAFAVFAHGFDDTYSAARTIVLHGTDIVLTARPSTVTYRSATTISATLVDAVTGSRLAGQSVDFYARKRGTSAYSWLGTYVTSSTGVASVAIQPQWNSEVRVTYYGLSTHLGATYGPIPVDVRPVVTATLSRTSVVLGGYATLSTTVSPSHAGQPVYLQRYYAGAWHNVLSHALGGSSAWGFFLHPATPGTYYYRVCKPGDGDHVAAYSPARSLTAT